MKCLNKFTLVHFLLLMVFLLPGTAYTQSCTTGNLDPRAEDFLKLNGKRPTLQEWMSMDWDDIRKEGPVTFKKLPEDSVQRIEIGEEHIRVNVVKYSNENNLPVIIHFHEGGFIKPLLPYMEYEAMRLSKKFNALVFDVDYRVAPEHKFPAASNDAYSAYLWVISNAQEYGGDPKKVILVGTGAGANLAALVMHKARKEEKHESLKSVLMISPMVDNPMISFYASYEDNAKGYGFEKEEALFYTQTYLDKTQWFASDARVWPIYETELLGMPPSMIVTTEFDVLRDEGIAYGKKLEKAGNRVSIKCFPQQLHAFAGLTPEDAEIERLYELMAEVIEFALAR